MKTTNDTDYESDFVAWVDHQASLIRAGQFGELDGEHLLGELESMDSSEHHELRSRLIVLLAHLLKCRYQPQRKCLSWSATLSEQRDQIALRLERSPSLERYIDRYINAAYRSAVVRASLETGLPQSAFPAAPPFSQAEIMDLGFIPPSGEPAYEADFALWAGRQSHLLRQKQFDKLDLGNLIEELDDMAGSQCRELRSRLIVIILHLLKCQYQPERKSTSWIATLGEQRSQIAIVLEDSPSLTGHLKQYADEAYRAAVTRASNETGLAKATFPIANPYSEQELLDLDFIP